MISTDAPFETLSKMHKSYNFDQNKIVEFEQFEIQLTDFLHSGAYIYNGSFVEAKHLVDKLGKIKIEIYSNEHPPAHFHISANGYKASLAIDDCRVLENSALIQKLLKIFKIGFYIQKID